MKYIGWLLVGIWIGYGAPLPPDGTGDAIYECVSERLNDD